MIRPLFYIKRLSAFSIILLTAFSHADSIQLQLDRIDGVYAKGDSLKLSAFAVLGKAQSEQNIELAIRWNNGELVDELSLPYTEHQTVLLEQSVDQAGSLIFEAKFGNASDTIGAIVDPTSLQPGSKRPQDFDTFWQKQKQLLASMPLNAELAEIELEPGENDDIVAFDLEIESPGPRPARAILAKPKDARPGSLPIVLKLRAAGVKGDWCRAHLDEAISFAKRGGGAISLDLNAHGMLNHEDEAYYEELENGPLAEYFLQGMESREDFYFRFMYLRLLRAIEFLAQQPEWDGERFLVIGESQGGGQALAAAGLDPRVSAAVAIVPAMCDFGGALVGRKGGWPMPIDRDPSNTKVINAVPYFDTAHLLSNSRAKLMVEIGLIDKTCTATSIYAAINQAKGEVIALPVPYRGHPWPEMVDRALWDETVQKARESFINDFLR